MEKDLKWGYPWVQGFFGQGNSWRESFLEQAFLLQFHLGMSYNDVRRLPIPYRVWFLDRLAKEFKDKAEARKKSSDRSSNRRDIPMGDVAQMIEQSEVKSFK